MRPLRPQLINLGVTADTCLEVVAPQNKQEWRLFTFSGHIPLHRFFILQKKEYVITVHLISLANFFDIRRPLKTARRIFEKYRLKEEQDWFVLPANQENEIFLTLDCAKNFLSAARREGWCRKNGHSESFRHFCQYLDIAQCQVVLDECDIPFYRLGQWAVIAILTKKVQMLDCALRECRMELEQSSPSLERNQEKPENPPPPPRQGRTDAVLPLSQTEAVA